MEKKKLLHCKDCPFYRAQWGECCFGGGWGHYPEPDDECARGYERIENGELRIEN